MKQNYLVTPNAFYKSEVSGITFGYAVQVYCCCEKVMIDKENSDWTSMPIEFFPDSHEMCEITEWEYLRIKEECEKLRERRCSYSKISKMNTRSNIGDIIKFKKDGQLYRIITIESNEHRPNIMDTKGIKLSTYNIIALNDYEKLENIDFEIQNANVHYNLEEKDLEMIE